jgi:hypothetical protein
MCLGTNSSSFCRSVINEEKALQHTTPGVAGSGDVVQKNLPQPGRLEGFDWAWRVLARHSHLKEQSKLIAMSLNLNCIYICVVLPRNRLLS